MGYKFLQKYLFFNKLSILNYMLKKDAIFVETNYNL